MIYVSSHQSDIIKLVQAIACYFFIPRNFKKNNIQKIVVKWRRGQKFWNPYREKNKPWASSFTKLLDKTSQRSCATPKKPKIKQENGFVGSDSEKISYQH